MIKRKMKLSGKDNVILHLVKFNKYKEQVEVPLSLTQEGISKSLDISQQGVSFILGNLIVKGITYEKLTHIQGKTRRMMAYFLSDSGMREAESLRKSLETCQYIDFTDSAPQLRHFYGRETELKEFEKWLKSERSKILIVSGIAGIGKTTLITKALESHRDSMNIFWHRLNEWATLRNVLSRLGDFMSETGRDGLSSYLAAKESIDINEVAVILAEGLEHLNSLLIFDDYQKIKEKKEITHIFGALKQILEKLEGTKVIVIGREVPRFYYDDKEVALTKYIIELNLGGLTRENSLRLLAERGIRGPNSERLYHLTRGYPLALELVTDSDNIEEQKEIKRYLIDEIFSQLSPGEKTILEVASVFRYPIYPTAFLDIAGEKDFEIVRSLEKKSLVQISSGLYDLHDLIRDTLYSQLPRSTRLAYHEKIARYYLKDMAGTHQALLEAVHHLIMAERHQEAVELTTQNGEKLLSCGFWQELLESIDKVPLANINPSSMTRVLLLKGHLCKVQGEMNTALEYYRKAIDYFATSKDKKGLADAHLSIGDIMVNRQDEKGATSSYRQALKIYQDIHDLNGIGDVNRGTGNVLNWKGDYNKALEHFQKALDCFNKTENSHHAAMTLKAIGVGYLWKRDCVKAREYLTRCIASLEEIGDRYELASAISNMGVSYARESNYAEAIEWYNKCIKISEENGDIRNLAYGTSNVAELYYINGDMDEALANCSRALFYAEKLKEGKPLINTLMVYGIVYGEKKDWALSEDYFKRALKVGLDVGDKDLTTQVYVHHARMLARKGHFDRAVKEIQKAKVSWEGMSRQTHWPDFLNEEIACLNKKKIRKLV